MPQTTIATDQRPTANEYALLSKHAYEGNANIQEEDPVPESNWQVVKKFNKPSCAFFAVLYKRTDTKQAVLAYRGTVAKIGIDLIKTLKEDLQGIALNLHSPHKDEAYRAVKDVLNWLKEEENQGYQLSYTGHSLGAFLAELSVFYSHDNQYFNVHAVTFESPGVKRTVENLQSNHAPLQSQRFDITTYLSYPNLINTCNGHVGTIYALTPNLAALGWIPLLRDLNHLMDIHTIDNILALFNGNPAPTYHIDWPDGLEYWNYYQHATFSDGRYKLAQFAADSIKKCSQELSLKYQAHYQAHAGLTTIHRLALYHLSFSLQDFLNYFYQHQIQPIEHNLELRNKAKALLLEKGVSQELIALLFSYHIVKNYANRGLDILEIDVANAGVESASLFRARLSEYLSTQPGPIMQLLVAPFVHQDQHGALNISILAEDSNYQGTVERSSASILKAREVDPNNPALLNKLISGASKLTDDALGSVKKHNVDLNIAVVPKNAPGSITSKVVDSHAAIFSVEFQQQSPVVPVSQGTNHGAMYSRGGKLNQGSKKPILNSNNPTNASVNNNNNNR